MISRAHPDPISFISYSYWSDNAFPEHLVNLLLNIQTEVSIGPFGMASMWSSDAGVGTFLYKVDCIIDTWSMEKAEYYASKGYVHHHEFVSVADGTPHPTKIPWLKHTAVTSFTLDRGPKGQNGKIPPYLHSVTPGIDWEFPQNGFMPYPMP